MKKMFLLSTMAILITGSVFWGCKNDEVLTIVENEQAMLKNGAVNEEKECNPENYPLVTKNNREVGQITVSNDGNFLTVEFTTNGSSFTEVQLWVGTDPLMVPKNRQDIPVPGRFTYSGSDNAVFSIQMSDLFSFTPPPGGSYDGEEVYIFAHAEIMSSGPKGDEEISAWSEGTSFGTSRWGSYSNYTICCNPTGGCTPYIAKCNYDNIAGSRQEIYTANGDFAGTIENDGEKMVFYFEQDWYFTDLLPDPVVLIYGYNVSESEAILVYEGEPIFNKESFTYNVPVSYYNYYKIQLNVQYCNQ